MRLESFGVRRWLLIVVAAWAGLVWVSGWFGLGGRIQPLAEDPALVPPLPQLAPSAVGAPQPLAHYAEIAARPLFAEDRRPHPFLLPGTDAAVAPGFDYLLTGVLLTPALEMAILQPAGGGEPVRIRRGDTSPLAGGWRLVELLPRSARFEGPDGVRVLELRVFNGDGERAMGAPPPMAQPAPPRSGQAPPAEPPAREEAADPAAAPVPDPVAQDQADAIRQRIEARRARLREQQSQGAVPEQKQ